MDVPGFCLVTGAASGIGRACAKTFALEGSAGVALFDLNSTALSEAKSEIEALCKAKGRCPQLEVVEVDISNEAQVNTAINDVAARFGRLDYVVNAAGIAMKHHGGAVFATTEDWKRIIDINLNGTFYVLRAAAKIMPKEERIVQLMAGRCKEGR